MEFTLNLPLKTFWTTHLSQIPKISRRKDFLKFMDCFHSLMTLEGSLWWKYFLVTSELHEEMPWDLSFLMLKIGHWLQKKCFRTIKIAFALLCKTCTQTLKLNKLKAYRVQSFAFLPSPHYGGIFTILNT